MKVAPSAKLWELETFQKRRLPPQRPPPARAQRQRSGKQTSDKPGTQGHRRANKNHQYNNTNYQTLTKRSGMKQGSESNMDALCGRGGGTPLTIRILTSTDSRPGCLPFWLGTYYWTRRENLVTKYYNVRTNFPRKTLINYNYVLVINRSINRLFLMVSGSWLMASCSRLISMGGRLGPKARGRAP